MMRTTGFILLVLAAVAVGAQEAQADPVFTNGSFETGTTGWTFSGAASTTSGGSGFDGSHWAWVGRRDAPSALISQTVTGFVVGATYDLTFLMGTESYSYNGGRGDTVNVAIAGAATIDQDFTQQNHSTSTLSWAAWDQQTYTFVADATSLTFSIHGYADGYLGYNSADAGVDRFALGLVSSPVPEPGSLALLAFGLGGIVAVRRRKLRATA